VRLAQVRIRTQRLASWLADYVEVIQYTAVTRSQETESMVAVREGLATKWDCAGENQQQCTINRDCSDTGRLLMNRNGFEWMFKSRIRGTTLMY
jgi:hypothetical protein